MAGYHIVYYGKQKFTTRSGKDGKACGICPNRIRKLFEKVDCFVCRHETFPAGRNGRTNILLCQDMIPIKRSIGRGEEYPEPLNTKRHERLDKFVDDHDLTRGVSK